MMGLEWRTETCIVRTIMDLRRRSRTSRLVRMRMRSCDCAPLPVDLTPSGWKRPFPVHTCKSRLQSKFPEGSPVNTAHASWVFRTNTRVFTS
jgi:hypothetical protein